jgi:glycerol-3-phosphate dehydrogenase (NAD+)
LFAEGQTKTEVPTDTAGRESGAKNQGLILGGLDEWTNDIMPPPSTSLVIPAVVATIGFGCGVLFATRLLRLRDRERLRRACSRTRKHLASGKSQRAALGIDLGRPSLAAGDCDGGRIITNKKRRQRVVVLGAGAFGTAMAYASAQGTDNDTVLYMRDADQCRVINAEKRNPKYLSDFSLQLGTATAGGGGCGDGEIRAICTLEELRFELSTPGVIILHALPCQLTPPWFGEHRDIIPQDALICITAKGLYLRTNQLMGHAILDALDRAEQPLAFLSGPSFAVEIMKGHPTTLVVASDVPYNAVRVQKMLSNFKTIRVFVSDDPIGVQLGGALKNPLAVGAGMVSAMGFGTNTLSSAVTRAANELRQLCVAMGANPRTIDGLAGMGDLMLTCFSAQSRNQRAGARLMTGETVEEIQKEMTVEGM